MYSIHVHKHTCMNKMLYSVKRTFTNLNICWSQSVRISEVVNTVHIHLHSDTPVAGGSKKPTLRKLHGKVNLDQENGKVTNNAYMGVWG